MLIPYNVYAESTSHFVYHAGTINAQLFEETRLYKALCSEHTNFIFELQRQCPLLILLFLHGQISVEVLNYNVQCVFN